MLTNHQCGLVAFTWGEISQEMLKLWILDTSLKLINSILQPNLSGANDLSILQGHAFSPLLLSSCVHWWVPPPPPISHLYYCLHVFTDEFPLHPPFLTSTIVFMCLLMSSPSTPHFSPLLLSSCVYWWVPPPPPISHLYYCLHVFTDEFPLHPPISHLYYCLHVFTDEFLLHPPISHLYYCLHVFTDEFLLHPNFSPLLLSSCVYWWVPPPPPISHLYYCLHVFSDEFLLHPPPPLSHLYYCHVFTDEFLLHPPFLTSTIVFMCSLMSSPSTPHFSPLLLSSCVYWWVPPPTPISHLYYCLHVFTDEFLLHPHPPFLTSTIVFMCLLMSSSSTPISHLNYYLHMFADEFPLHPPFLISTIIFMCLLMSSPSTPHFSPLLLSSYVYWWVPPPPPISHLYYCLHMFTDEFPLHPPFLTSTIVFMCLLMSSSSRTFTMGSSVDLSR